MATTRSSAISGTEVLRRGAEEVDGPLRAAVARLPGSLRAGAGFHFGWLDAAGTEISAAPGKRVRPAFVLAAARAVGGGSDSAVRAGVAVELVHNFSLVHDDVMDADRTRRGRPTVWAQYGVPYAILLGDAMLALANRVLTQDGLPGAAALCAELNSAVVALCLGQRLDMDFEEHLLISPDDYLEMASGKTAALLSGSCVLGAMASGAGSGRLAALRRFGHHVGLAFQLVDDVLGIFGDPKVTGKPAGADLLRYKKSMPVLAATGSGSAAGEQVAELYRTRTITHDRLGHAADLVARAGGREWTEAEARRQLRSALRCLDEAGVDPDGELGALADLVANRNR
ncbi:polyprenyl synthetase family protein [Lentzea sp. NPDC058436]|uniref:polyprenyl synthetase family protein n=1 Tax=Lentzea sp. NPDC058436 TaxID=3346499 RepID=UPI0036645DD7